MQVTQININKWLGRIVAFTLALAMLLWQAPTFVSAAALTDASLSLGDSRPSQTGVTYTFDAGNVTTSAIKCILLEFNTQADGGGSVPTGMTTTGGDVNDGSTDYIPTPASWTMDATANGTLEFTFATGETPASATDRTVTYTGITNGSTAETTYFALFSTYNDVDCTSSPVDDVTVAFVFINGQAVSLSVDSTLTFALDTVAGSQTGCNGGPTTTVATTDGTIPFGTVTTSANGSARHDTTVSTNAANGYSTYIRYTAAPTNGSHNFTDHTGTNAAPTSFPAAGATEAFGYTTDGGGAFGSDEWAGFTTSNELIATDAGPVSSDATCIGYQVAIEGVTPAGLYQGSTVIVTATPQF